MAKPEEVFSDRYIAAFQEYFDLDVSREVKHARIPTPARQALEEAFDIAHDVALRDTAFVYDVLLAEAPEVPEGELDDLTRTFCLDYQAIVLIVCDPAKATGFQADHLRSCPSCRAAVQCAIADARETILLYHLV